MRAVSAAVLALVIPSTVWAQEPGGPKAQEDNSIVRGVGGDFGMFFRFGGLASLFVDGTTRPVTQDLLLTQFGLKIVISEEIMIPIFVGAGFRRNQPDQSDNAATDWGFDVGGALEWHFRIWRRISPYVGVRVGLNITDFDGEGNSLLEFGIGPLAGVEYYIFDRVSLQAQYTMIFNVIRAFDQTTVTALQTLAGGAMNLTYYF